MVGGGFFFQCFPRCIDTSRSSVFLVSQIVDLDNREQQEADPSKTPIYLFIYWTTWLDLPYLPTMSWCLLFVADGTLKLKKMRVLVLADVVLVVGVVLVAVVMTTAAVAVIAAVAK